MWYRLMMESGVKALEREKRSDERENAWACQEIDTWGVCGRGVGGCEQKKHGEK